MGDSYSFSGAQQNFLSSINLNLSFLFPSITFLTFWETNIMNLSDGDMNFEPKMKKEICVFINLTTRYIISIYTCVGKYSKLT